LGHVASVACVVQGCPELGQMSLWLAHAKPLVAGSCSREGPVLAVGAYGLTEVGATSCKAAGHGRLRRGICRKAQPNNEGIEIYCGVMS
jgi:hypothetical protein